MRSPPKGTSEARRDRRSATHRCRRRAAIRTRRRHHADDGVAAAVEEERSANRIGCRAEQAVPQTVAENRDTLASASSSGQQRPADRALTPERGEERARRADGPEVFGFRASRERWRELVKRRERLNDRDSRRQSTKLAGATQRSGFSDEVSHTMTNRSGAW